MRHNAYRYIHNLRNQFIPRTPGAALQAAEEEILPIEAFVYKSTALNPLLKKPYNMDEIEWLLSRKDRDLTTNLILKTVLDELARDEDKEIALFAAESLNALEKDYNNRLVELKEKIEEDNTPEERTKAADNLLPSGHAEQGGKNPQQLLYERGLPPSERGGKPDGQRPSLPDSHVPETLRSGGRPPFRRPGEPFVPHGDRL